MLDYENYAVMPAHVESHARSGAAATDLGDDLGAASRARHQWEDLLHEEGSSAGRSRRHATVAQK
jgi:hypothetical protein